MAARGFIGAGDVYMERFVAGVSQGLKGPFYAGKFEIKPNIEKKELTSKGRSDYGQVLESISFQKPAGFTLELNEVNTEALTIALLGTASNSVQIAGNLTAANVTIKLDSWVPVGKEALGATAALTNTAATVTYVEGLDYELNRPIGLLKIIGGRTIVDGAALKITVAHGAISSTKISGATNTDIRAKLIFDGKNQADGLPCIVTVWEAIIAADSAFDFLGDDFNTVTLPGTMKTPTGKTEPFVVELRNAA